MRVKRGFKARRRRNRVLDRAEGFYSGRSRLFAAAVEAVRNAWQYGYQHRREKKREFRALWINRIGAAARECGVPYGRLVSALGQANVALDRKMLADLAVRDPGAFKVVVGVASKHLGSATA